MLIAAVMQEPRPDAASSCAFPKGNRLLKAAEFQQVFQQGRKIVSSELVIYVLAREATGSRLGMAVSRKVGKSVHRSRIKRLLREAFRLNQMHWPACDLVVVARPGARQLTLELATRRLQEAVKIRRAALPLVKNQDV
ncbi:ribonuclease P protein component [Thermithiobacillus plumbiphilus]|uniref:Ribonuclease P protein component n=1 Tax=Thermithiobacillus plumbiphilus TaxID=1729899 RepID=A0ABU9D9Y7_9PROT